MEDIEEAGRIATAEVNKYHFSNSTGKGSFNAVREYGYVIPYLTSKKFIGLDMPEKPSRLLRFFMLARNLTQPGKVSLKGDITPASQLLLWSHFVFGHLFANIGDRNKMIGNKASEVAAEYNAQISKCWAEGTAPEGSLLSRFKNVEEDIRSEVYPNMDANEYERHVRSIVFELSGAMQMLVGTSFANILATIFDSGMDIKTFLELIKSYGDDVLDEALRINPTTTSLYRVAEEPFMLGKHQVNKGDHICLMVGAACKDPDVFEEPDTFFIKCNKKPKDGENPPCTHNAAFPHDCDEHRVSPCGEPKDLSRDKFDYLNFGPYEASPNDFNPTDNTHPCFGQYWARSLLKSMLRGP